MDIGLPGTTGALDAAHTHDQPLLEHSPGAALLVDAGLRVRQHNAAAATVLARPGGLLALRGGRLAAQRADAQRQVERGVAAVLHGQRCRLGLALPRAGELPMTLHIGATATAGLALIELRDPCDICVDAALLCDLFGLTRSEAKVAALVCDGRSVAGIAAALRVQGNTVSAHLKRVLNKCDVARQPQLVALLLRSVAARGAPAVPGCGP